MRYTNSSLVQDIGLASARHAVRLGAPRPAHEPQIPEAHTHQVDHRRGLSLVHNHHNGLGSAGAI